MGKLNSGIRGSSGRNSGRELTVPGGRVQSIFSIQVLLATLSTLSTLPTLPTLAILIVLTAPPAAGASDAADLPLEKIVLPLGFSIQVFAEDLPYARSMTLSPEGTLFVGTRPPFVRDFIQGGKVYAIRDLNGNGRAEPAEIFVVAEGLNTPNGVAFQNGSLYVAEIDRILRYDLVESWLSDRSGSMVPAVVRVFPSDRSHGWKFIRFGPDGKLYVPVGAPCNVCLPPGEIYATIARMNPDGSDLEIFARGVRNTVGFDWDPSTGHLWFTDNGRDWLGDDTPPDELNLAPEKGMHFGFPYCHGGNISDPEFGGQRDCGQFVPPALALGPHVAALGMRFYSGTMFPSPYRGQIFIAEHGSWNREHPIGYRVVAVKLENGTAAGQEIFARGWLQGESAWGRPVDVEVWTDGSLLVSDGLAGVIYRISRDPE
ncbi:MAG: sorbosone dehydrogenase family protein [Methanosarcinales archaeon]|nr:sorbosone dehydrogenase family protein [Methanosarcinales archaeon]